MAEAYEVVIPAYNAADLIGDAIRSILGQTVPPARIIVVDDGSTDATAAVAARFDPAVTVIRQKNRGCGGATNAGLAAVAAPLVGFLDADDLWLPGKAACQLEILAARPDLAGVFAAARQFRGRAAEPELGPVQDIWGRTTMMIRTEAARRIGPMIDPPGMRGDMIDWIARGRDLGLVFEMLEEILALRRIRAGSLSYGRDAERDRGYLVAVKRALDRRRAAGKDEPSG